MKTSKSNQNDARRHVLVTGAAGGIGAAIVEEFAKKDYVVGIHYRTSKAAAEELHRKVGKASHLLYADLRIESAVEKLFEDKSYNTLIVNAATYIAEGVDISSMSVEQWNGTFNSNVLSAFLSIKHFLRAAYKNKLLDPTIVLIGSTAGQFGEADHADYASSKSALKGLLLSAKNEIVRHCPMGRINMVSPTWTLTAMAESFLNESRAVARSLQTKSIRKLVRPDDVAKASFFLAENSLSGHISGVDLVIGGGMEGRVLWNTEQIDTKNV